MDVHGQQRDLLTDIVVELARNAATLDLLCGDDATRQLARIVLADVKRLLVRAQRSLGAPPPRSLHQQTGNQAALYQEYGQRSGDVAPVLFPERVFAEADVAI